MQQKYKNAYNICNGNIRIYMQQYMQRKYKNAYNRLLHSSTGGSTVGVVSGVSTIGTAFTVVGLPRSASLGVVITVSTFVGACLLLTSKSTKRSY